MLKIKELESSKAVANIMLLTTALLWGSSYSFRKMGLEYMTPFFFNFLRFFVAFLFMIVLLTVSGRLKRDRKKQIDLNTHIRGGFFSGTALAFAAAIQQWALLSTTAGKVGFITSLYTVFVPVIGIILFKTKVKSQVWIAVGFAMTGLVLISGTKDFTFIPGDLASFVSAIIFGFHILIVGHYTAKTDGIILSSFQMLFGCLWNLAFALVLESGNTINGVIQGGFPILYTGVFSIGLSFTLQIFAQKKTTPSVAAVIMSLESVFAVLFGLLILGEKMTIVQLLGCTCIFAAVIIAQIERKS